MSKPNDQHQQWLDLNPCGMCGNALNRPFGRERSHGNYIVLEATQSCGGKDIHDLRNSLRRTYVGRCCFGSLSPMMEESV
jgi:hypothetical protein